MQFGHQTVPFPRRWSGGRFSMMTILIALNVGIFILTRLLGLAFPGVSETILDYFALSRGGIAQGYYWQFLSYMFLHGGVLHLLVNCMGLYFAGREVETVCGRNHLLAIFFLGGLIGGIAQLIAGPEAIQLIGASGGVCAVILAFTTILPELEITALIFFVIPLRMRAKWLGWAVIVSSIVFAAGGIGSDIGHVAHLGGALTGWFYVRRNGYGGSFFFQRYFWERRRNHDRQQRMTPKEFISEEIDPILEKISREGIHSLTRAERRILELGRDKIANRTRGSVNKS
ncbi:MAG TPA: rhomboid family intramembrane serine protease [Chthoniobacteraceae bacterium]|nr:rhomboid family intramembrane serine protease [Chthoniobacteraceae bacterium]